MICHWHFRQGPNLEPVLWPGSRFEPAASLERSTRVNNEVPRSLTLRESPTDCGHFHTIRIDPAHTNLTLEWRLSHSQSLWPRLKLRFTGEPESEPEPGWPTIDFNLFNLCINFCACLCSIFFVLPGPLCINYWHLSPLKMKVIQLSALTLNPKPSPRLPGSHGMFSARTWHGCGLGYWISVWRSMDINRWQFSCNCVMLLCHYNWQASCSTDLVRVFL